MFSESFGLKDDSIVLVDIETADWGYGPTETLYFLSYISRDRKTIRQLSREELPELYKQVEGRKQRIDFWVLMVATGAIVRKCKICGTELDVDNPTNLCAKER